MPGIFQINLSFSRKLLLRSFYNFFSGIQWRCSWEKILKHFFIYQYMQHVEWVTPCSPYLKPRGHDLIKLIYNYFRQLWDNFDNFWLNVSGKEKKSNIIPYHCIVCDYLHFEEDQVFYLDNLEFPSPKDDLYIVRMKMVMLLSTRMWLFRKFYGRHNDLIHNYKLSLSLMLSDIFHFNS
jgi:hypothetical protein